MTRTALKIIVAASVTLSLASVGVLSAYVATTSSSGNAIQSGTVAVAGDVTGPMYAITGMKPGDVVEKCIRVTYTGSLAATVKAYVQPGITNGSLYNLKIERGTQTTGSRPACGDFSPSATVKADGPLGTTGTTYAAGYDIKGSAFGQNDSVTLRFTITHNDDTTPNAHASVTSTGNHDWTFEARNN